MSAVAEIHHVAISVRDLEASVHFYESGLGMRKTLEMPVGNETTWHTLVLPHGTTGRSVFLQGPTRIGQVELIQWNLPVPADSRPKRAGDPGFLSLSFHVDAGTLHEIYARMQAMGVPCNSEPKTNTLVNYGEVVVFFCQDPDGNLVEIIKLPTYEETKAFRAEHGITAATTVRH